MVENGFYHKLLADGMLSAKDYEPDVSGLVWFIDAFRELSTCKNSLMGLSPIPFDSIARYAKIYNIESEDFEEFLAVIRIMDKTLIKLEKSKNGTGNSSKKNKG